MKQETRIYFFSDAGHSFAAARYLAAERDNTVLINITSLFDQEKISSANPDQSRAAVTPVLKDA